MRKKYDGDDVITVLLTAEPTPKESLLFEFKRIRLNSIQGLYIGIDRLGKLRWRAIKDSSGCSFEDPDDTAGWIDGLKEFEVKNGRIVGRLNETDVEDVIAPVRYSVSFSAPVKD